MNLVVKAAKAFSSKAREGRASIFKAAFFIDASTRILDLGSETGANIHRVLQGTAVRPSNVYIADIDAAAIEEGRRRYGFVPVRIDEAGRIPFPDGYFDIVYCSSVIEHVTVPKHRVWGTYSGGEFRRESLRRQESFAREITRVGRQYFVQTPYRHFPIESHSWLPCLAWLPRRLLIPVLRFSNLFWVKKTSPDWHLLDRREMARLFADSRIVDETVLGLTKSMMAVKTENHQLQPGRSLRHAGRLLGAG